MEDAELKSVRGEKLVVKYPAIIHDRVAQTLQDYVDGTLRSFWLGNEDSGYRTIAELVGDDRVVLELGECEGVNRRSRAINIPGKSVEYRGSAGWIAQWNLDDGTGLLPDDCQIPAALVSVVGACIPQVRLGNFDFDPGGINRLYRKVIDFTGDLIRDQVEMIEDPIRRSGYRSFIRRGVDEPELWSGDPGEVGLDEG